MGEQRTRITPRTLKGFRDYLPAAMIERERLIDIAKRVYRSYGFAPIDTPALEYAEVLTGKGGEESDKQLYRFTDSGGRDVALRFDLTVPFARFAAQYVGELGKPFKRYHIGPVWRGENTQRGRYREFVQCDFDTIGTESIASDVETALVIHDLFTALDAGSFSIRCNNRRALSGLLERLELTEGEAAVLRAIDKLAKIGPDKVAAELVEQAGATAAQAAEVLALCTIEGETASVLDRIEALVAGSERGERGLRDLRFLAESLKAVGVPEERFAIDVSIARGLDYYTGTVFETFLADLPGIGSVCSGGRYDDLAGLYTKESLPGIGASLGLDRLLAAFEELGRLSTRQTPAAVFIPWFEEARFDDYLRLAARIRSRGIGVELYPEARKLGAQLKYADRKGFRFALVLGENEWAAATCQLKDLESGETSEVSISDGGDTLAAMIAAQLT